MGKIDSSYQARLDGMAFALRVAEKRWDRRLAERT